MSNIIDLLALADSAARHASGSNTPNTMLQVAANGYSPSPTSRPEVVVACLDCDVFPVRGALGDRVRVTHTSSLAWLRVTGEPGEDPENLLFEAIDYLSEQPLVETVVPL